MATATGNYVCDNSSLANFKSWAQAISNAFGTTCGWTQTSDTGQVNWSTIASVPSSTYVYEIWKAADSLASTMPIYVKVEYGFSGTAAGVRFTVGTSSNGSGTINGVVLTSFNPVTLGTFSNQGATTYPCYFSGSTGEIRILMWSTNASTGIYFAIERSKDSSGNDTADYVTALSWKNAGAVGQQTVTSGGLQNLNEGSSWVTTGTNNSTGAAFNGTVAAFPIFPLIGKLGNPMLGTMCVVASDVSDNTSVTVASMYGSTHTYHAAKFNGTGTNAMTKAFGVNGCLLMRYE